MYIPTGNLLNTIYQIHPIYQEHIPKHQLYAQTYQVQAPTCIQSGRKCGVGSQRTCIHFIRLVARILTTFDNKYRILTCRDKRESYLIVLQQNNV